jgi:hypothetical protein
MLISVDGYHDQVIKICPDGTEGDIIVIDHLPIMLPKQPKKEQILFHDKPQAEQMWSRLPVPKEISKIRSMDEWLAMPLEFKKRYTPFIEKEFERRRNGVWFYNNGEATYITGSHYMILQWSKFDIGYPSYYAFQRKIAIHMKACFVDPRCLGQLFTKCRRSGYTNVCSGVLVDEGTQVAEKLLGIQSKTGKDAQENIFMKKVVPMYRGYPFFFKPIQDGTTNPRMELAFREPSKRITKDNKTSSSDDALNTIINWKNTVNNAYDGEKVYRLYLDEAGKWEKPTDINEAWRIQKTCLIVGRKVVGKAMVGSTVNPMDKGGREYKSLIEESDPRDRDDNGRTQSGLYALFVPAYEAFEGFFDEYGNAIVEDPLKPVKTIDGDYVSVGAKTFLRNERKANEHNAKKLNELTRQFPFTIEEAVRESVEGSHFDVGKIYQQIDNNNNLYPDPVVVGNFTWAGGIMDSEVVFTPMENGRWRLAWMPPKELRNVKKTNRHGKLIPPNAHIGRGGVDSYDLDATVDGRGSKGACHLFNKFNPEFPSNKFVAEYKSRPPLAKIFYEDVLMACVFFGYPLLIENNKYGIVRYFEERGYDEYVMDRPDHLKVHGSISSVKTKGVPSNSTDVIQAHAQAIEDYIFNHIGVNQETGEMGDMVFNRTLEDWIGYKIDNRTKYDLTISSGLALLAAQDFKKTKPKSDFNEKVFFRTYKNNSNGLSTPIRN